MTIIKHELRQGSKALAVWTVGIGLLMAICMFLYPELKEDMGSVNDMFASMGTFTAAFGMDRLGFGTLIGYYAIECGSILSLGGAFYAALTAAGMLSKEEHEHTAEFLMTHPISRGRILTKKLIALFIQVTILNLLIYAVAVGSIVAVGEDVPWKDLNLLHLSYYLMQLELTGICFGISAFLHKGSAGLGLGIAVSMYFMNLIANITDKVEWLKKVTPFGYCEAADIVSDGKLDSTLVAIGMAIGVVGIALAYLKYTRKDLR